MYIHPTATLCRSNITHVSIEGKTMEVSSSMGSMTGDTLMYTRTVNIWSLVTTWYLWQTS